MFGPEELRRSVQESLNSATITIPNGHKSALVAFADKNGIRTAFATRTGNGWQLTTQFQFSPGKSDKISAGVSVIRSW